MTRAKPWHGVLVATALPLRAAPGGGLAVDFDAYADHVASLAVDGCDGVTPNGSLGEYPGHPEIQKRLTQIKSA